jgi:monoterpene epsilon-lactone hydrolase
VASEQYETFISSIESPLVSAEDSLEVARDKLEAMHGHPVADSTSVEWVVLGGVRCAWVAAADTPANGGSLFLCHGGAFIAACDSGYLFYAEMLSRHCGARVLLVDYRLAPQHLFPAALDDCVSAYRGLMAGGVAPENVAFIGDSCGGGLAVSALVSLRDAGDSLPGAVITLGGWFDLEASGESAVNPQREDPFAAAAFTRARGRDYVGPDGDLRDPLASPLYADPVGLPPMLLQVGQVDLTRDDATRLADKARRCGVDVTLDVWPEMVHGFQGLAAAGIPEGLAALDRVGDYFREHISRPKSTGEGTR